ncbi:MAG: DUF6607 family protein [Pseudomonadota bacterium]
MKFLNLCGIALLSITSIGCATVSDGAAGDAMASAKSAAVKSDKFDKDRDAILAMVGNHRVKFEFWETVAFVEGYTPKDPYLSGGDEVVLVVEDRGDFISLQHILVIDTGEEKFPIKHWRQDWQYEPEKVLTFIGGNSWEMKEVASSEAKGKWSQTVYQVDDSPRYGAVGEWSHGSEVSQWIPPAEWRPLPRRDMTTRDDYHAMDAVNVHAVTPSGWVHEQNNLKVALDEEPTGLVRELGVNTYDKFAGFDASVATDYWSGTKEYWSEVRKMWTAFETPGSTFGLTLKGEPQDLYMPLMEYAEQVQAGDKPLEVAVAEARDTISKYTTTELPPLKARLRPSSEKQAY